MKPEFSEVLLRPEGKGKYSSDSPPPEVATIRLTQENTSCWTRFSYLHIISAGFLLLIAGGLILALVLRYETKFVNYESRISALESDLALFLEQWEAISHPTPTDFMLRIHDTGSYEDDYDVGLFDQSQEEEEYDEDEAREIVFGEVKRGNRKKRQAPSYHESTSRSVTTERNKDGVAILEGSYPASKDLKVKSSTPSESEGLRVYESFITTGGHGEPKAPEFAESEGSNVQAYHRTSAAWSGNGETTPTTRRRRLEVKSGDSSRRDGGIRFGDDPFYVRTASPFSTHYSGALASRRMSQGSQDTSTLHSNEPSPSLINRRSRVPSTGEHYYPRNTHRSSSYYPTLRRIGQGDGQVIVRVHQDKKEVEDGNGPEKAAAGANHGESSAFATSRTYKGGYSRHHTFDEGLESENVDDYRLPRRSGLHQSRKSKTTPDADELSIVQAEAWAEGPKTIAAHYVADSSNFTLSHRHYEGNGRLRNADGIFRHWKPAEWLQGSDGVKEFELSTTGVLTVKKAGLYYVYAQVQYLDQHDINSFVIQINSQNFISCTTHVETIPGNSKKSSSCFTAGLNYLKENDRILLRDLETNRFSIIKPEKTFFGLMRIGEVSTQ